MREVPYLAFFGEQTDVEEGEEETTEELVGDSGEESVMGGVEDVAYKRSREGHAEVEETLLVSP